MLRIALKSAFARKGRLLLTSFAVVLGTAFLAGSFIFTDTIKKTFDTLFADINEGTDAFVRSSTVIEGDFGLESRNRISASLVDTVAAVDGVTIADPQIQGTAVIFGRDDKPMIVSGPTFGGNSPRGEVSPWVYDSGTPPVGPNEVVIDKGSAKKADGPTARGKNAYVVGDTVKINAAGGTREFTISGIVKFGDVDSPGGASYAIFDLPTTQEFLLPQREAAQGLVDAVIVQGDGSVSQEELAGRIAAAVIQQDADTEVLTGAEITAENQSDVRQGLNFFTIFLTIFALVALFVGSFVIANVFSITQAQRLKENALMRAIGANSSQVSRALMVEALIIGFIGSLLGLLGGVLLAIGLKAFLAGFGIDIPSTGLTIVPRTIALTLIAGVMVTVVSAVAPAIKSGRVKPIQAMRDGAVESNSSNRVRLIIGVVMLALGATAIIAGLGGGGVSIFGLGIPVTFIALYVLLPLISRPLTNLIGKPIAATRGITGQMAVQNAGRNPKRTARTAAALLIGVALVAGVSVVAASVRSSVRSIFAEQFTGDYAISLDLAGGPTLTGFDRAFTDSIGEVDGVAAAAGIAQTFGVIAERNQVLTAVNPATAGEVFDLKFVEGKLSTLTSGGIAISEDRAKKDSLSLGSTVKVTLIDGVERDLTVESIYSEDILAGDYTLNRDIFTDTAIDAPDLVIFVKADGSVPQTTLQQELETKVAANGLGELKPREKYIDDQAKQINQIVNLVIGLLILSVFIAVFGIILTLSLSVLERRKELALSRAVGMSKAQVRSMIRWEAVITSLLGTIVGVIVGLGLGYALVFALRDEGFSSFTIPVSSIVVMFILAVIIGVASALWPSRRANKTDVVSALASG
jgi:putative ABC transport system permease protein